MIWKKVVPVYRAVAPSHDCHLTCTSAWQKTQSQYSYNRRVVAKMVISCCAPYCTNRANSRTRERGVSFYRIPRKGERRRLWLVAIRRKDYNPGPNTYICSDHFVGGKIVARRLKEQLVRGFCVRVVDMKGNLLYDREKT